MPQPATFKPLPACALTLVVAQQCAGDCQLMREDFLNIATQRAAQRPGDAIELENTNQVVLTLQPSG